ncbi:lymphocyte antigen 75 [Manduca sexta]|uniref:C-type lectin domain-containing protein n=1 Tax=Manduca sexta TaxID=7130 RepID=A0A921YRC4_MANSE|nr:lymphocyte antigen 75 [Manduca sexta]KAG6444117.1 hypothetical protein O3G_MSEX003224 [Manduca sexta]
MEVLPAIVLFIAALIVNGSNEFRPDYEYHASAGGWFKFHKVPAKWHDARLMCSLEGAVLASPINVDVSDVMQIIVHKNEPTTGVYTGVNNLVVPVIYNSIEGVPLSAMPIRTRDMFSEEYSSGPQCARLLPQTGLVAGSCSDDLPYMCYKNQTAKLGSNECGTTDTDYKLDKRTGHCYKFHKYSLPWTLAYMTCDAEGGQLAVINSAAEANVVKELFAKYPPPTIKRGHTGVVHLGFQVWNSSNVWRTINGQSLEQAGFANWTNGAPNSYAEYYGSMTRTGQLDDTLGKHAPFVCEKHPNNIVPVPNNV